MLTLPWIVPLTILLAYKKQNLSQCIIQCLQYKDWNNICLLKSVSVECHNDILCKQLFMLFSDFSEVARHTIFSLWNAGFSPKHFRNHKSIFKCNKNQCNFKPPLLRSSEGLFSNADSNKRCGDTVPKESAYSKSLLCDIFTWFSYFLFPCFSKEVVIAFIQNCIYSENTWKALQYSSHSIWTTEFSFPVWNTIKLFYQIKLQSSFAAVINQRGIKMAQELWLL